MTDEYIFISYSRKDDEFVNNLRQSLEECGISVWIDSQNMRGGSKLHKDIADAIEHALHTIVVLGPNTVNSPWVREEISKSLETEKQRTDGYQTIPLLLPGIKPEALTLWFKDEPLAIPISLDPGALQSALPEIMAALGKEMPSHREKIDIAARPCAELILKLEDPEIKTEAGETRACGTAHIVFKPAAGGERSVESKRFGFRSPIGPVEFQEISWYLEDYFRWPVGVFRERAKKIEENLTNLGKALYDAVFHHKDAEEAALAWKSHSDACDLRFSVMVDRDPRPDAAGDEKNRAEIGATGLLSIPWELLHNGEAYLFKGAHPVAIRRQLPNRKPMDIALSKLPVRILLVTARPEDECASYIDHRVSALPLVKAVENLGELVTVKVLSPATFPAVVQEIKRAYEAGKEYRYDVLHFDGHGVFDDKKGLGALCFEDPQSCDKLYNRKSRLVHAEEIAECLHQYRIPLVFLEACQSAKTDVRPASSVAAALLEQGAASVIAMTHSVLVETATRFVEQFYKAIAQGASVGKAVLDARLSLALDTQRGKTFGSGNLELHDWFVPVLYQDEDDPQLFTRVPPEQEAYHIKKKQALSFGNLITWAERRNHRFVGRSRELLALERLLVKENYAAILGQGGAGKTTIAVEAALWLIRSGRFKKGVFLCVENLVEIRGLVDDLGRQLLPSFSVGQYNTLDNALKPIRRVMQEYPVIIVIDNMESLLPDESGKNSDPDCKEDLQELFELFKDLLDCDERARIVFTSREKLPPPFGRNPVELGALSRTSAVELVSDILKQNGKALPENDSGETPEAIEALVEAVNCHARALVLLTNEVAARGVQTATNDIQRLMADMEERFPGNREKSLYASMELSLQRLPEAAGEQLKKLALFHGGVHLDVLGKLLKIEQEQAQFLGSQLIDVGLAEDRGYGHLDLDPALSVYMRTRVEQAEFDRWQEEWAGAVIALTDYLNSQLSKDAHLARQLTLLELPNLMAVLDYIEERYPPEKVTDTAARIEQLIAYLHRPKALQKVVKIREKAGLNIKEWCHAAFVAERMAIERLLSRGNIQLAFDAAQKLLEKSMKGGERAYPGADYDIAGAYFWIGSILGRGGNPEQALPYLENAQKRFQTIAETGDKSAKKMVSECLGEKANCLTDSGRLDDAVKAYEEGLHISERLDDKRAIAVIKGELGTVRMLQQQYEEAIALYTEAKELFQQLGEYKMVSAACHQIGMVYQETGNFKQAERAYKESLAISIKINDKAVEAASLTQFGNLYNAFGYFEEAVSFYRQACDIHIALKDILNEGKVRNNVAYTLIKLKRFDEAREEILKAIECKSHFGHAAQPWTAFGILYDLETAAGNSEAACQAWQKAFDAYLGYRRNRGYGKSGSARVTAMFKEGIKSGNISKLQELLKQAKEADLAVAADKKLFLAKLEKVLEGNRDLSLAMDIGLHYMNAVELYLLLEGLQ
jgi:tetratricopeptide (TPR) repeat protein